MLRKYITLAAYLLVIYKFMKVRVPCFHVFGHIQTYVYIIWNFMQIIYLIPMFHL